MKKTWVIASESIANNIDREFFVNNDGEICQELKVHFTLTYCECGAEVRWSWMDFIQYYSR